ncbi:hypothetical protein PHYSODRAFT_432303, partial [Phytophthora sojae]
KLRRWLKKGTSADDVFQKLKLNRGVESIVGSPKLETMATYVRVFNKKNPGQETTLMKTITNAYGEAAVAKGLEAAANVHKTKSNALELQGAQFNQWIAKDIKVDDVLPKVFQVESNSASALE